MCPALLNGAGHVCFWVESGAFGRLAKCFWYPDWCVSGLMSGLYILPFCLLCRALLSRLPGVFLGELGEWVVWYSSAADCLFAACAAIIAESSWCGIPCKLFCCSLLLPRHIVSISSFAFSWLPVIYAASTAPICLPCDGL